MEVAGPCVVAKARPCREHIVERRSRKSIHGWPACKEFPVIGPDCGDGRLLQNDFRQPYAIGIGRLARASAPGQRSAMPVVPTKQGSRWRPGFLFLRAWSGHSWTGQFSAEAIVQSGKNTE